MRLPGGGDDVVFASTPDDESVWMFSPSPLWAGDFLASIEKPTSERLTSISVAFSRLGELLRAQLHALGLETLELRLDGGEDAGYPPLHSGEELFLRAPQLRSVLFNLANDHTESVENALAVLRASFHALLVYDAVLLDSIVVSRDAEHVCAGFAPFAKEYFIAAGGCCLSLVQRLGSPSCYEAAGELHDA